MKDLILDETTTISSNYSNHVIKYIGIGVFSWLAIVTFAYTLELLTKNGLLMTSIEPVIIFGAANAINLLAVTGAVFFVVKKISGMQLGDTRIVKGFFAKVIVVFVLLTLIQFLIGFYLPDIYSQSDIYFDNSKKYWDFIGGSDLMYVKIIADFLPYMIVGMIFWRAK